MSFEEVRNLIVGFGGEIRAPSSRSVDDQNGLGIDGKTCQRKDIQELVRRIRRQTERRKECIQVGSVRQKFLGPPSPLKFEKYFFEISETQIMYRGLNACRKGRVE